MFSNLIDVLQGPGVDATDEVEELSLPAKEDPKQGVAPEAPATAGGAFSIWGMASALADTVKKTTAEVAASVSDTDWKAELEAFGKGVADDTTEVQRHTRAIVHEGAKSLEGLPQRAAQARLPSVDPHQVKHQLDQVGNRIGRFGTSMLKGSKELFEQVQEAVQRELDGIEGHINQPPRSASSRTSRQGSGTAPKYSRLDTEISAMQRNSSTYCDQPEDAEDFAKWLQAFNLDSMKADIETIIKDNAFMAELQSRIVPLIVQYDVFWTRYFYQLDKLVQKHEQRQSVAQRAAQAPVEHMAWDDDSEEPASLSPPAIKSAEPVDVEKARIGRDTSPPTPADKAPAVPHKPKAIKQAMSGEEPDTSTASDDSGNGPWTVVTSPSHQRRDSEVTSPPPREPTSHSDEAPPHPPATASTTPASDSSPESPPIDPKSMAAEPAEDEDELDSLELSADEGPAAADRAEGAESDVDEDWGEDWE